MARRGLTSGPGSVSGHRRLQFLTLCIPRWKKTDQAWSFISIFALGPDAKIPAMLIERGVHHCWMASMSKLNTFLLTVVLILQASTLWLLREISKDVPE